MSLRRAITNGVITLEECDWGFINDERIMRFRQSDLWMISDRFNNLTTEQQTELITYRQALRDITDYETANDAADNFPSEPDWMD